MSQSYRCRCGGTNITVDMIIEQYVCSECGYDCILEGDAAEFLASLGSAKTRNVSIDHRPQPAQSPDSSGDKWYPPFDEQ